MVPVFTQQCVSERVVNLPRSAAENVQQLYNLMKFFVVDLWIALFNLSSLSVPCQQKALCQQFRKEAHIRNLPSLFKKPKPDKDLLSSEALGLEALFSTE